MATAAVLACGPVTRERPVFHPDLGRFFSDLRETHGWTLRGAASLAKRRGLGLSYQALFRLERGQVKNPEPEVMRAVAALYTLNYDEVVERFVSMRYGLGSDLVRHSGDQRSGSLGGPADVPASDAVGRLESFRERNRSLASEVRDAIRALTRIATSLEEEAAEDSAAAPRRARRNRKVS